MIGFDSYYGRKEVSNSDLSELDKYFRPLSEVFNIEAAYRFGNLIDAMITEPHRCDHIRMKVDDEQFSEEDWTKSKLMLNAFRKNEFCRSVLKIAKGQSVFINPSLEINYEGMSFTLPMRCKYDLWSGSFGVDVKSTTATSQQQFEDACHHFGYLRQRAVYMELSGANKDMLIGISKTNFKIFTIAINRGDYKHKLGYQQFSELAFKWWYLFH